MTEWLIFVEYAVMSISDCSRSGDFRSITHHFRSRRSADHSFQVDRDSAPVALSDSQADHGRLSDESGLMSKEMVDHMTEMSQKMMDVVDQRIEGMEDMMKELKETMNKLNKKVN